MNATPPSVAEQQEKLRLEQEAIIRDTHAQWLTHPGTSLLLQAIRKQKKRQLDQMTANATSGSTPDSVIRFLAVNIKNTEAIESIITDADILIKLVQQEKQ